MPLLIRAVAYLDLVKLQKHGGNNNMKVKSQSTLKDGVKCKVTAGTHAGKSGIVSDINTSKTGHLTITVTQKNGERFKTLGKNVVATRQGA